MIYTRNNYTVNLNQDCAFLYTLWPVEDRGAMNMMRELVNYHVTLIWNRIILASLMTNEWIGSFDFLTSKANCY